MHQVLKAVAGIGAALFVLVGFAGVAGAQYEGTPPEADVLVFEFPSQVSSGGEIAITGNCTADDDVEFSIDGESIGSVDPDDSGDFTATFDVPDLDPGSYAIVGTCGEAVAEGQIEVLAAGSGPGGDGGTGGTGGADGGTDNVGNTPLARTGFDARPVVTLGAAALVLGGAAVYGSRRRRALA